MPENNLLFLFHLCMGWMLLVEKWFRKHKPVLTVISHHLSGNPSWWPSHAWYTIRWHQPCTRTDAREQVPAVCDSHVTVTAWQGWTTTTYLLFSFWSPLWLNYPPQQHQNSLFLAFFAYRKLWCCKSKYSTLQRITMIFILRNCHVTCLTEMEPVIAVMFSCNMYRPSSHYCSSVWACFDDLRFEGSLNL